LLALSEGQHLPGAAVTRTTWLTYKIPPGTLLAPGSINGLPVGNEVVLSLQLKWNDLLDMVFSVSISKEYGISLWNGRLQDLAGASTQVYSAYFFSRCTSSWALAFCPEDSSSVSAILLLLIDCLDTVGRKHL
jgi:hypothetical protein